MPLDMISGIGLAMSALLSYGTWYEWKKYRAITQTPRSKVRSIAMGHVELTGTIHTDDPLTAPLTGTDCVCYDYKIEEEHHDDDGSDWHTVKHGRQETQCKLTDDTGTVDVDLNDVSIEQGTRWREDSHSFDNPPEDLQRRLDDLGVDWEGWFGANKSMRYTETRITNDDTVYLLGTAQDHPDVEDGTSTNNEDDILITSADNLYLISNGDEDSLTSNKATKLLILLAITTPLLIATLTYLVAA